MPDAARVGDATQHGTPLGAGPGSSDVKIGYMAAWRAVPSSVASAIDGISSAMKSFMDKPVMTPANAAADIAKISQKLTEGGAKAAAAGAPAAAGTASSQLATLNTVNGTLTTAWTSASAAPGGQPAANQAYTEGIKTAAGAAAAATMSAMASLADMHTCPTPCPPPPHGPGFVTKGSSTVVINNLPACRKDDKVMEACGGPDPISMGCSSVIIGDESGGGAGSGGGGGGGETSGGGGEEGGSSEEEESSAPAEYSEEEPSSRPPGQPTKPAGTGTHWIELEMVDEAEEPVVGELYVVQTPDGKEIRGGLDEKGQVRITGIKNPGSCIIKFPNLDLAVWERWRPGPSQPSSPPTGAAPPFQIDEGGPVPQGPSQRGGYWRQVSQGECMSSLAADTGHFWSTIWNHPANAELKRRRGDPNVLLPGDAVFIPDKRLKEDTGATDARHKFRRRGEPSYLRLKLMEFGKPLAGETYILRIDGRRKQGTTDPEGLLVESIPGNARRVYLRVAGREYRLKLGALNPVNQIGGIQMRLNNLGFLCGPADGTWNARTRAALNLFRSSVGLPESPEPDAATLQRLLECHDRLQHGVEQEEVPDDDDLEEIEDDGSDPEQEDKLDDLDIDN